ncbi:MAG: pilus assembly protein TadG-related protein [Pseudomonadota bacterium]
MTQTNDTCPSRRRRALARDERGAVTIWMVFWTIGFLLLGGVALDAANAWRVRAALQAAADATAHAAALTLRTEGERAARDRAQAYAREILPADAYGDVLKSADIEFGIWDAESRALVDAKNPDTVRVTLRRSDTNDNAEPTYLLRLAGLMDWDVSASSAAKGVSAPGGGDLGGDENACWRNGLVARGVVDVQSNNVLRNLCVHGEQGVSVNNGNDWTENVTVSMPDLALLDTPSSDIDYQNPGLSDSLLEAENDPYIVDHVDEMIYSIIDQNAERVIRIDNALFEPDDATPGWIYWVYCVGNGGTMTVPKDSVLRDVTILTNCAIRFKKSVTLVNTLLGTTGDRIEEGQEAAEAVDSSTTVVVEDETTTTYGSNELRLGLADGCDAGGGARLLIDGDFRNPAKLRVNGSQIIASGDVEVAAQGESIDGVSVLAGGNIDLSSNNTFGACLDTDFDVPPRVGGGAVAMVE